MTKTHILIFPIATLALLAACSGESETNPAKQEDTPEEETATGEGEDEELVSIFRPEIEQPEQEEVQLEPLKAVVGFPEGGSELSEAAIAQLKEVMESEQLASGAKITLRGHSDAGGNDAANERASQARAEAVRDWLVDQGVKGGRITIIAFGEQNPVEPNALPNGEPNEKGRAANRRVEITAVPPKGTTTTKPAKTEESADAGD